jgi:hypothetical protein
MLVDEFNKFNQKYEISSHDKFVIFRTFITENKKKTFEIPLHLINKYNVGGNVITKQLTNVEIYRNVLSKLSELNMDKLFDTIKHIKLVNLDEICNIIYIFSIDLDYMQDMYIKLYKFIKLHNELLYNIIYNKILEIVVEDDKRWYISKHKLINKMYLHKLISDDNYNLIISTYMNNLTEINLELICILIKGHVNLPQNIYEVLYECTFNKSFNYRIRSLISNELEKLLPEESI